MSVERRIRTDIERRIHSGEWRPGDRIPFEHQLVETYGCSRATVSKALGTLARSGLIERRRKAGSFVAHPTVQSAVLAVPDLAQLIAARGEVYRWSRTSVRLASEEDDPVVPLPALLIEGVHHADGEPFALERRMISIEEVPEVRELEFDREAPGTWLLRHVPWTAARHEISAVEASPAEARALSLPGRAACLELRRTTWRSGREITTVRQLFRGDRFHMVAEFRPGSH